MKAAPMRNLLVSLLVVSALAAPRAAFAADDDTVKGFLVACDAGSQACMMDVLSSLQRLIYIGKACPNPDEHEDQVVADVVPKVKDAAAKNPALANGKTDASLDGAILQLYPCTGGAN